MDIEPLWALGGWFLFSITCMATPKSQSTISETFKRSHHFFLFLALLFVFILLTSPSKPINPTDAVASISIKRLLLESSEPASTTMNLHPKHTQGTRTSSSSSSPSSSKSTRKKFGAQAHEVPSGPNPISNR
ncbi:CLAVATA3/ESR (CLE)-related protein 41 [Populus alba]|uniref:CLAVATA3/ESR (CLE)-related protein 41 n=1 Tax=Populus alba TaxID=43335 RepID=UPI00158C3DD7|nr:CLAVATA3/ESR (CLE)-related protein 41 [Populus alba]